MRTSFTLLGFASAILLASCTTETKIERVREVPIKTAAVPSVETGLHRAQLTYVMRGALTEEDLAARMGEYYYVTWSDAHPQLPAELVMSYQQSVTGSQVKQKRIKFAPRKGKGTHKDIFSFIGKEYEEFGSLLAWRVDLKMNGKIVSTRRSYLWRDDVTTRDKPAI